MKQSKNFSTWQRVPSCLSCHPWPGSRTCWWGWGQSPVYQLHWRCPVCPPQGLPHEHLLYRGREERHLYKNLKEYLIPSLGETIPQCLLRYFKHAKRQTPLGCPVYIILHKLINAFYLPQRWGGGSQPIHSITAATLCLGFSYNNSITATNVHT